MEARPKVLITGVSGYIGLWVAKKAIDTGEYEVCGTVRDKSDDKKIDIIKEALGDQFKDLELVEADLLKEDTIDEAVKGCTYVIHVASPFIMQLPDDENTLIKPAVDGTKNVLNACKKHGVTRLVVTSSCAAIEEFDEGDKEDVDESSFAKATPNIHPYTKSKILAEEEVWKFVENQSDEADKLEIVVINPSFVVGPVLAPGGGASESLISNIMNGTAPALPLYYSCCVDVRDVADAHIKGLKCEPFQRFALSEGNYSFIDIASILQEEFKDKKVRPRVSTAPKFVLWLASFVSQEANFAYQRVGVRVGISSKKAKDQLGIKFTPINKSLKDMGESFFKFGLVKENN